MVLSLTPVAALPASDADQAVEQFHRLCLAERPNFESVMLIPDDSDWEPVAEGVFAEIAPAGNPPAVRVSLVDEVLEGLPAGTIVGVSRAAPELSR
jgi:hypothetical protein